MKNGELLKTAEADGFDVFVTCDKNLSYQQNLKERKVGIILLSAQDLPTIRKNAGAIVKAIEVATPSSFQYVDCVLSPD